MREYKRSHQDLEISVSKLANITQHPFLRWIHPYLSYTKVGFECHLAYVFNTIIQMSILCLSLVDIDVTSDEAERIGRESS